MFPLILYEFLPLPSSTFPCSDGLNECGLETQQVYSPSQRFQQNCNVSLPSELSVSFTLLRTQCTLMQESRISTLLGVLNSVTLSLQMVAVLDWQGHFASHPNE